MAMASTNTPPDALGVPEEPSAAPALNVLRWEDERTVAALLARAFIDDPLVTAICEAPIATRQHRMTWGFRVAVRSHCLAGQPAWTIIDSATRPLAVVLVNRPRLAPSPSDAPSSDTLFSLRGLWHLGVRAGLRGMQAARLIAAQVPAEPFTYLRTLGVEPTFQGRGFGSCLVEQVVQSAPALLPIYLETAKEGNLRFYARHGFSRISQFSCLGVPIWGLLRRPQA